MSLILRPSEITHDQHIIISLINHSSSTIIDDTRAYCSAVDNTAQLAYYYFSLTNSEKQLQANFLRSIIAQFCDQPEYLDVVDKLYEAYGSSEPPIEAFDSDVNRDIGGVHQEFSPKSCDCLAQILTFKNDIVLTRLITGSAGLIARSKLCENVGAATKLSKL